MQLTGERSIKDYLRQNPLPSVCFMYGEDGYQTERYSKRLIDLSVAQFAEFNFYKADGSKAVNTDELCDAVLALPFMSDRKAVLLNDLDPQVQDDSFWSKLT